MAITRQVHIIIDKLTRSIENAISGDSFKTEVLTLTSQDLKIIKKKIGFLIGKQRQKTKVK